MTMAPPPPVELTGQTLDDRYRLGPVIGRGAMSEVYRATDQRLDRTVAVKVLRPDCADPVRFVEETNLLRSLDHPNLVRLLDTGTHQGSPYLVLNLLHETLADRLRHGLLPATDAARIGAEIAAALGYLHANGIVHRDIKPSNILLRADGTACLADLGAALAIDGPRHTATGLTIGTPLYLAPEQATGDTVTSAADIYALGLVLLEATTGHVGFEGTQAERLAARVTRPPALPPTLPAPLRRTLAPMVAVSATGRPEAVAVAHALGRLAVDETIDNADPERSTAVIPAGELLTVQSTTVDLDPSLPDGRAARGSKVAWWAAAAAAAALVIGVAWPREGAGTTEDSPGSTTSIAPADAVPEITTTTAVAVTTPPVVTPAPSEGSRDGCGSACGPGKTKGKGNGKKG